MADNLLKLQKVTAALHELLSDTPPAPPSLLEQSQRQFILLAYFKSFLGPKRFLLSYEGCTTEI